MIIVSVVGDVNIVISTTSTFDDRLNIWLMVLMLLNDRSHYMHRFYTNELASNTASKEFGRASSRELNCRG